MTEGEQEKVIEPSTTETPTIPEGNAAVQPKTYSEDEVKRLLDDQFNKLNGKLSAQGAEINKLKKNSSIPQMTEDRMNPISSLKAAIDVLADESNLDPVRVQKLAQLRSQLAQEETALRFDAQKRNQQKVVSEKYDELQQKATEAGLDLDDDSLGSVMDAFEYARDVNGDFGKAFKRLDKVIEKVKKANESKKEEQPKVEVKEEKKPETEVQLRERIERETLEKYGLNKAEKAGPSASGKRYSLKQVEDMSPKEVGELLKQFPGKSTLQLIAEGVIK